ncbi:11179_t:CDS:2 [Funneliformis geosporum]|uniref:2188_t:CDS:1 n=1 Tax=Funneliformis geosporum TaxID=1117311 RepID=A0A9W4SGV2_9GLOM|nr:11179_t:CDS:2 [Funneliformis geosporum]CAI2168044.1 2188_t:CDS:2 [Funneliformis geosporum]
MTTNENRELQEEEFLALTSIFGEVSFQAVSESYPSYIFKLSLDNSINDIETTNVIDNKSSKNLTLRFHFPPNYPSSEPPNYEIVSLYCGTLKIDQNIKDEIEKNFNQLFVPGEVVIFSWIEWLQDFIKTKIDNEDGLINIRNKNQLYEKEHIISSVINTEKKLNNNDIIINECPKIIHGEPLEHKKSLFIAHLASVSNIQQVQLVRTTLLLDRKIAKATHNIMAYRIVQENGLLIQDNDDDGETAAGSRLLHLLQITDAKNVVVIVSRWFGGILLGPERFKDILNCSRDLLEKCGYITRNTNNNNEHKSSGKFKNKKKK